MKLFKRLMAVALAALLALCAFTACELDGMTGAESEAAIAEKAAALVKVRSLYVGSTYTRKGIYNSSGSTTEQYETGDGKYTYFKIVSTSYTAHIINDGKTFYRKTDTEEKWIKLSGSNFDEPDSVETGSREVNGKVYSAVTCIYTSGDIKNIYCFDDSGNLKYKFEEKISTLEILGTLEITESSSTCTEDLAAMFKAAEANSTGA